MQSNIRYNRLGFTLIETSAVLVILAIVITSLLGTLTTSQLDNATKITNDKITRIEMAISAYMNQNGFLPCPARRDDAPGSANFGVAGAVTGCATAGSVSPSFFESGASSDRIRIGALPTRDLGLPDDYMFDGWNNRFTYVVNANLAQSSALYNSHSSATTGMTIIDGAGNTINSAAPTYVAYVLISHGKIGLGARNWAGSADVVACGGATNDVENCNNNSTFRDQFEDNHSAAAFNNIMIWRTKSQVQYNALNPTAGIPPATIKYGLWENRFSGAVNVPKAAVGTAVANVGTQIYNTTDVTNTATTMTFQAGKSYFIKEGHMACGTGATQFNKWVSTSGGTPAINVPICSSTIEYLDTTGAATPCIFMTCVAAYTFTNTTTTTTWIYSNFANAVDGMGRGVNTGGGDNYVFDRVEVWQR